MNYPKPKILTSVVEPNSPKYIAVPEYKHSIERAVSKSIIFDDVDGFGPEEGSGGLSKGMKNALLIGIGCIAVLAVAHYLSKKRR